MIQITDKTKCSGCTACLSICPNNAIFMLPDEEGFLYPVVDPKLCVNCDICNKVCPVENEISVKGNIVCSYVLRAKDTDTLMQSTSGGFISPLTREILNQGGVVCAAGYDTDFNVSHMLFDNPKQKETMVSTIRGSKYVQSDLKDNFMKLKQYLDDDKTVCFIGTTCQVNGLKAYLRKEYKNLITVDLVCHGTPSPKLWNKYLKYQISKFDSKISSISFRNKTYGYHSGTMKICFDNGKIYYGSARVDYMLKSFFSEISSRPICYKCPFKTLKRCSDFTIYDCWHASDLISGLKDDDKGYTNVIVQSEKGKEIINKIKDLYQIYLVDDEKAVSLDGIMIMQSAKPHSKRDGFYIDLDDKELDDHIQDYIPITRKDYIIEKSKGIVYKFGIYKLLKWFRGLLLRRV